MLVLSSAMRKWLWILTLVPCLGLAQLRVATWNISNYGGGRISDVQTVLFASYQGRSVSPDVLVTQEILSAGAQTTLLSALNSAPGSSGTWAAAPFTDGSDTDNAFFYRADRLQLVGSTIVGIGGLSPKPPRDTKRYDVRLLGYSVLQPKLAIYSCHMKAGTAPDDEARRLAEASLVRNNAASLVGFDGFMVVGDFNTYSSSDDGYTKLTGSEANNTGRFSDPIATPGSWDGSSAFRYIHTQDPATASGMNSRFDFLLLCRALVDGQGFEYIGNPSLPYSTVTWNDPAHSYRAWGNDGSSFDNPLTITGNAMVGPTIAQAIVNAATTAGGHIPVFLDLKVPAESSATPMIVDFGTVVVGQQASRTVTVTNAVSTTHWNQGIADLLYQLTPPPGFGAPTGSFTEPPSAGGNGHSITMNTGTPGEFSGNLAITSQVPGTNTVNIGLTGKVVPDSLPASSWTINAGTLTSGGLSDLTLSDNAYARIGVVYFSRSPVAAADIEFTATSPITSPNSIQVTAETGATYLTIQKLDAYDFASNQWVMLDSRIVSKGDLTVAATVPTPNNFLEPGTRRLKMRLRVFPGLTLPDGGQFEYRLDRVAWVIR